MKAYKSDYPDRPCSCCSYRKKDADGCCQECRDLCPYIRDMKWVRCPLVPKDAVCDLEEMCLCDWDAKYIIFTCGPLRWWRRKK